ncbi:MAG: 3-oxoacyl-ACP reductase FabG [Actinobacteria bacterium]|nr:3-oxoacyl-ACP reductase FabG [Actinomycetota bacterium]
MTDSNARSGRVALVTGASSGIGRATALRLARAGCAVGINHLRDHKAAEQVVRSIASAGGDAVAVEGDVSEEGQVRQVVDHVSDRLGPIEVLVNNAGIFPWTDWEEISVDEWDRVMAVNARGPFLMARACVPGMRDRGWGRVISMSSATYLTGSEHLMHYAASKAAVVGFTRSLARAVGDDGITANAVTTGKTLTAGLRRWFEDGTLDHDAARRSRALQPIKRFTEPDDVAAMIAFLASEEADFITGQLLNVDGGRNML